MKIGYSILVPERYILITRVDDYGDICNSIGCRTIKQGMTFASDDQLLVNGDQVDVSPEHWFWVHGVLSPFSGNAVLIGVSPDGFTLEQPVTTIDEFRSLITFPTRDEIRQAMMQLAEGE